MGAVAQQVVVRTLGIDEPGFGDVVRLVDDYRVHYRAQSDLDGTERWLRGTASRAQMRCYLATAPDDARAAGVPRISLQTESDNDAARGLYRSLGFIAPDGVVALSLAL
jgi:hypothetical protein